MTDNEIIKAFEYCPQANACTHAECPLFGSALTVTECAAELNGKVLDLIQRQQGEIENWKAENARVCAERDAHIVTNNFIKDKAVKEFAERLNEKAFHDMNDGEAIVCCCDIDNLVKEMVGGSDDRKTT